MSFWNILEPKSKKQQRRETLAHEQAKGKAAKTEFVFWKNSVGIRRHYERKGSVELADAVLREIGYVEQFEFGSGRPAFCQPCQRSTQHQIRYRSDPDFVGRVLVCENCGQGELEPVGPGTCCQDC